MTGTLQYFKSWLGSIGMTKTKKTKKVVTEKSDFFEEKWNESWTYIKTVVDVVREPVLILDKNFRVMAANESFYEFFQVKHEDTEGKIIYELGNGQWDIPDLHRLFEELLPKNIFFKGFEVTHDFPVIGKKTMILNARHIHFADETKSDQFRAPITTLAIEDVTGIMAVADFLKKHTQDLELKLKAIR